MDRFNVWVGSLFVRPIDLKKDEGQTFVEYALVLSVIVVGVLLAATWAGLDHGHHGRDHQDHRRDQL